MGLGFRVGGRGRVRVRVSLPSCSLTEKVRGY